jgi:DNA-directed RNA polymerase subunit L
MEIKVVENNKNKMKVELTSEDHTLANLLRKTLWEDSSVDIAAYKMDHPLTRKTILMVTTTKGAPKDALKKAAGRIEKRAKELASLFSKKIKK